jgi:hypothetical protein
MWFFSSKKVNPKYSKDEAISAFLKDYEMNNWYFRGYFHSSLSMLSQFDMHKNSRTIKLIIMEDLLRQILSKPEGVGFILYHKGISDAFKDKLYEYYTISGWDKVIEYYMQIYGEDIRQRDTRCAIVP